MAGHNSQTLNYRIMQIVLESAKSLGKDIFTANDVVDKVHESLPNLPSTTIRTYVLAMSSIRDSAHHFDFLGNESYRLISQTVEVPAPPRSSCCATDSSAASNCAYDSTVYSSNSSC